MSTHGFPSFDDIYRSVDRIAEKHCDIVRVEKLGASPEGRPIRAAFVTDNRVADDEKQVALVVCGRHGQEFGTRVVGPALLEWLVSGEALKTRRRQRVIVVPVANPDGCVREQFWAPTDGLSDTEQSTIGTLGRTYQPDAVMDVHSWGGTQDGEALVIANTRVAGEDAFIYSSLAMAMVEAAARRGYPFLLHSVRKASHYNNFLCGPCYEHFHSLVFGLEVNHAALSPPETAASGLAVIQALLNTGNIRSPWQHGPGYPNGILAGDFLTSIRATGSNAAERRASRVEVWQNREAFTALTREFLAPNAIRVKVAYAGDAMSYGFAVVCRVRGLPRIPAVRLNGDEVKAATHADDCSTYVSVGIRPSGPAEYELLLELDRP